MSYLDVLQAAGEGATPGPWTICGACRGGCQCGTIHAQGGFVGRMFGGEKMGDDDCPFPEAMRANTNLAALSRNVWAELVAVARAADKIPVRVGVSQEVSLAGALHALRQAVEEHKEARDG